MCDILFAVHISFTACELFVAIAITLSFFDAQENFTEFFVLRCRVVEGASADELEAECGCVFDKPGVDGFELGDKMLVLYDNFSVDVFYSENVLEHTETFVYFGGIFLL
jgi:hypothetical protein